MKNELNPAWILNLSKMWAVGVDNYKERALIIERMAEYVKEQSHDTLYLDIYSKCIVQKEPLPWSYLFDLIKNAPRLGYSDLRFIVLHEWPPCFKPGRPNPAPGTMYALYNSEKKAVMLRVFTGECIENRGDDDGFGVEPDEHEVLEGLRNRDGDWIEELRLLWI